MSQTDEVGEGIVALLRQCVVKVSAGDSQGTGFVIGHGLVLTCRHVVERVPIGADVSIGTADGRAFIATVDSKYPDDNLTNPQGAYRWPDLAILALPMAAADIPAVVMDTKKVESGITLLIGGYPADSQVPYQTREFSAGSAYNFDDHGHRYLSLKDDSIDPGLSGAPVLAPAGFVCGYVRLTKGAGTTLGGWVVPLSEVLAEIDQLHGAYQDPGPATGQWLKLLPGWVLKTHGRDETGRRFEAEEKVPPVVDIQLKRDELATPGSYVDEWDVCLETEPGIRERVKTADLGAGVLDAVDQWSRRHQLATKVQVELLGRVLHRALMPAKVHSAVSQVESIEPPLLRLRTERQNPLTAIPWEYAHADGLGVAITPRWSFARYVDTEKGALTPTPGARALLVVNGSHDKTAQEMELLARKVVEKSCARIHFEVCSSLSYSEFAGLLRSDAWDVVHYIGTGSNTGALGFAREWSTPGARELVPVDLATVSGSLSSSGVKLVVLQLGAGTSELSPSILQFLDLLGPAGQVRAVVLAEHASTTDHVLGFTSAFYSCLDKGWSVERSVQEVRRRLHDAPPGIGASDEMDYAAFGTVSVTTTKEGHIRLLTKELASDSDASGTRRRGIVGETQTQSPHLVESHVRRSPAVSVHDEPASLIERNRD